MIECFTICATLYVAAWLHNVGFLVIFLLGIATLITAKQLQQPAVVDMQIVGAGLPDKPLATIHAPMTVLPTPFPRDSFEKAQAAMEAFNSLFDRVSCDDEYLQATLKPAAQHDEFTVSC